MFSKRWVLVLAIVAHVPRSFCVVMPDESQSNREGTGAYRSDTEQQFGDSFFQCYKDDRDSAVSCIDQSTRAGLSALFSKERLELSEGLSLIEEEPQKHLSEDPLFRDQRSKSFVDAASSYLGSRSIRWDMNAFYPGLVMRVGPTLTAGSGVLEFVMEPTRHYTDRTLGPGRLIMRQTIVPLLLGVKVSVAALVPLLLFGVVVLVKKALLLSQVSALLTAFLGFGSLAAAASGAGFGGGGGYPTGHSNTHIVDGLPLRHRRPHVTQLAGGPLIVDVPPPWSNRNAFRAEESSTGDRVLGDSAGDHSTTRTERRSKNPRGFLWESSAKRGDEYRSPDRTSSNIFPRES